MDAFDYDDYKALLKDRLKELKASKRNLTLKVLAQRVRMQYTYLSSVLNNPDAHLGEEQLYRACRALSLGSEETDFALLIRSHAVAEDLDRKEHLHRRISRQRDERKLNAEFQDFSSTQAHREMTYLFNPLAMLVYISLHIERFRKDPLTLAPKLGISTETIPQILSILEALDLISLGEDRRTVRKVLKSRIHYGKDHPLMRVHQGLLKTLVQAQVLRTPERDKSSFLVTFTADSTGFERIQSEFNAFLKRVESIASGARSDATYQLSFDLFKWL